MSIKARFLSRKQSEFCLHDHCSQQDGESGLDLHSE